MKKLATIFVGLSLFIGSSIFAQGDLSAFYPAENNDSPNYGFEDVLDIESLPSTASGGSFLDSTMEEGQHSTSKSKMKDTSFDALYPIEEDDSHKY